jgi:hypothetical protein
MFSEKHITMIQLLRSFISCEKDLSNTKSVEATDFVLSKTYFPQLINIQQTVVILCMNSIRIFYTKI